MATIIETLKVGQALRAAGYYDADGVFVIDAVGGSGAGAGAHAGTHNNGGTDPLTGSFTGITQVGTLGSLDVTGTVNVGDLQVNGAAYLNGGELGASFTWTGGSTGQFISLPGTATTIANLDADKLDGQHGTYYRNASNVNAGTLAVDYGGTGLTSYTAGDVLYASGATTLAKLGIGSANYVLTSSGSAPQWSQTIAHAALPASTGTWSYTGTLTFGGALTLTGALRVNASGGIVLPNNTSGFQMETTLGASVPVFQVNSSNNGIVGSSSLNNLSFFYGSGGFVQFNNGSVRVFISSAGRVGLGGNSSPAGVLHFASGSAVAADGIAYGPSSADLFQWRSAVATLRIAGASGGGAALEVNGSLSVGLVAKTSAYTLTNLDHTVLANATSGAFNTTLPTAVGHNRVHVVVKNDASANAVTLATTSGQTINGAATLALAAQWDRAMVQSDGANWVRIA